MREELKTRIDGDKSQVFCIWRHRWVRLTPEEWVRQQFLHHLVEELAYPSGRIGVEVAIHVGDVSKRCDAVVYDAYMRPWMLLEFKAESVALTQRTLDQAAVYNRKLKAPYLILSNGPKTIAASVTENRIEFLNELPQYFVPGS